MSRRREILDAALECFLERGVSGTTLEEVRERARASVGSLYHHFPGGREAIAAALHNETLAGYREGFVRTLARHREAERGVKAAVRYHVRWIAANPDRARFLLDHPRPMVAPSDLPEPSRRFFSEVRDWAARALEREPDTVPPVDLLSAVWIGPAQEFMRHWLAGNAQTSVRTAEGRLAQAAWGAFSTLTAGDDERQLDRC